LFAQRRDAAIIATCRATGIRLSELAGIRYDSNDTERSDLDLWRRKIIVRGKNSKARVVKINYQTARAWPRLPARSVSSAPGSPVRRCSFCA
jgi:integrase/recombinase XerD